MSRSAIDIALSNRAVREDENIAIVKREAALAKLRELGVERDEKCSVDGFYSFAMNVLENFDLQSALSAAKEDKIRVVVTSRESYIDGEDIFINCTSRPIDAVNFLLGD